MFRDIFPTFYAIIVKKSLKSLCIAFRNFIIGNYFIFNAFRSIRDWCAVY